MDDTRKDQLLIAYLQYYVANDVLPEISDMISAEEAMELAESVIKRWFRDMFIRTNAEEAVARGHLPAHSKKKKATKKRRKGGRWTALVIREVEVVLSVVIVMRKPSPHESPVSNHSGLSFLNLK